MAGIRLVITLRGSQIIENDRVNGWEASSSLGAETEGGTPRFGEFAEVFGVDKRNKTL